MSISSKDEKLIKMVAEARVVFPLTETRESLKLHSFFIELMQVLLETDILSREPAE